MGNDNDNDQSRNIWIHLKRILPDQRAYLAGQGLAGLSASMWQAEPEKVAERAVRFADAVIAELARTKPEKTKV